MNAAWKAALSILFTAGLFLSPALTVRSEDSTNQAQIAAAAAAHDEAAQRRAKLPVAKGLLVEVDLLRHQIKLNTEDGKRTFTYTPRTYMFRDKDKITAEKLKVGELIAVRFTTDKDGNATLTRLKAQGPPPSADTPPPAFNNQPLP